LVTGTIFVMYCNYTIKHPYNNNNHQTPLAPIYFFFQMKY
jgi:hypothetical protein